MACYHPLKAWAVGTNPSGKPKYHITSYECDHVEIRNEKPIPCFTSYISPYSERVIKENIEIPCGKCIGCRLAYSRMWADRCIAEATRHKSSYFVTFTYNDDNLPKTEFVDDNGEIKPSMTLVKEDFQKLMKRIRKNYQYDNKLRFFMAGEYGSQSARPHYHAIIFGLQLDDLEIYKKTELGFNLYTSKFLENCWQHKGYVIVAEVTWETCAYTARYILKKQTGKASEIYEQLNIIPEFTLMSRKPGIARDFYEENKLAFLKYGEVPISTMKDGRTIKSVKYFDKLLEIEYPKEKELYKEQIKKNLEIRKERKLQGTDLSYLEMLQVEENKKVNQTKPLIRKEI